MNENMKFESARKSIIAMFGKDEETGLTPLEFLDTFDDVNEFSLKSVLPLTYNTIRKRIEENAYRELAEDYFSSFCVVRLSNDSDYSVEVFFMWQQNLKCALEVCTNVITEIENGRGYHCSMWQISYKKEDNEHTVSIKIECVGEHSNWKPIIDSLAKVKKLNVGNILQGYDMYLAGKV